VPEGERERLRRRVERDVGRVLLDLAAESLRLHAEAGVNAVLLGRDAERAILAVGVDDDARDLVPKQFLNQHPEKVALPPAGLREHADVALHQLVDVQLDAEVVIPQQSDVGARVRVVLQSEHFGDERLLGSEDVGPGAERDRRHLDEPLPVPESDDPGDAEQALVDGRLVVGPERARGLEVEVALALQVVQLAEDLAVQLVDDRQVVAALDRLEEAEVELAEADVAEDPADLLHTRSEPAGRILA